MSSTKTEKTISNLPEELRPIATSILPVLIGWGEATAIEWLQEFVGGDYQEALATLYRSMKARERNAEQKRQNALLKDLNFQNATLVAKQRQAIWKIFLALLKA